MHKSFLNSKGEGLIFPFLFFFCLLFPVSTLLSQNTEEITITTYYPSPYGVYNELETRTLYFSEGANRLIAFTDTDNQYSERLRITTGESDTADNDQGASIDLHGNNIGGDLHLVAGRGGNMVFWTSPGVTTAQDRMYILPNGNVGIGTAAPSATLDLRGDATRPTNICVRVNYDAASGVRSCPAGYYIAMGTYANVLIPTFPGYVICCQTCVDGGDSPTLTPPDGICD